MLDEQHPDLALCEISAGEQELCKLIQEVRQDRNGYNPFVAFIITAWTMNADLLAQISNSGADDLLLRPFSTALLGQRIESLVDRYKKFVGEDYVGSGSSQLYQDKGSCAGQVARYCWKLGRRIAVRAREAEYGKIKVGCYWSVTHLNLLG